jgi:hypothetical protein
LFQLTLSPAPKNFVVKPVAISVAQRLSRRSAALLAGLPQSHDTAEFHRSPGLRKFHLDRRRAPNLAQGQQSSLSWQGRALPSTAAGRQSTLTADHSDLI